MSGTTIGVDSSNSRGVSISSSSNLDLADPFDESTVTWTEITSSTPEDWIGFDVSINNSLVSVSGAASNVILLIATGAASSETRIATILPALTYRDIGFGMYVPIPVSSGTRISAAVCQGGTSTWYLNIVGVHASGFSTTPSFSVMDCGPFDLDAWNTNVTPSGWVPIIDPGGAFNTKGSYTELSFTGGTNRGNNVLNGDSLANTYQYIGFQVVQLNDVSMFGRNILYDVATGAASSESNILSDVYFLSTSSEFLIPSTIRWVKGPFSSGTRISARAQCNITTSNEREFGIVMYGVR